ncbi:hypothetical protein DIPPA_20995, partial [Diplonema papillatum]
MRHLPAAVLAIGAAFVADCAGSIRFAGDTCGTVAFPPGKAEKGSVRCCKDSDGTCDSDPDGECFGRDVGFDAAAALCRKKGYRLCTWDELKGKCCGTGCGYDNAAVWFDNCQGHKCVHGECEANLEAYTCTCTHGYTGEYCDQAPEIWDSNARHTIDPCGVSTHPLQASSIGAVRCCRTDGKKCISTVGAQCLGRQETFESASSICSSLGYRICALAELKAVCCGTGCGYDAQPLWFDNCQGNMCDHGTCEASSTSYKCVCDGGYTGTYCGTKLTGDAWMESRMAFVERGMKAMMEANKASAQENGRLKGAVAAMGRQLVAVEQRTAERVRAQGNSGLTMVRAYHQGTDAYHTPSFAAGGAANVHNHANTHHTVGMGEFGAVLNGVQFTTRHNDYSLLENDDKVSAAVHISTWPPKARAIPQPRVPPSVLQARGAMQQMAEMREYFRAFKEQDTSIRDYRPYFPAVLCYLEGTWVESAEGVDEPFSSERHHIDAESWSDLNEKTYYLFNNGQ